MIEKVTVEYRRDYTFEKSIDISVPCGSEFLKEDTFKKITELSDLLPRRDALPGNPLMKVLFEIEENEGFADSNFLKMTVNLTGHHPSDPFPREAAEKVIDCLLEYVDSETSYEPWSPEQADAFTKGISEEIEKLKNQSASDKAETASDSDLSQAVKDLGLEEPEKTVESEDIPQVQPKSEKQNSHESADPKPAKNNPGIVKRIADRIEDCFSAKENKPL